MHHIFHQKSTHTKTKKKGERKKERKKDHIKNGTHVVAWPSNVPRSPLGVQKDPALPYGFRKGMTSGSTLNSYRFINWPLNVKLTGGELRCSF